MVLHAEVKALQDRLGIAYKDASHRLYMAEIAKLKAEDIALKSHRVLIDGTDEKIRRFEEKLSHIIATE